ncbi:MAG: aminotransferase class I/II-fold pyridoxal phosphate-dependent enzyme [Clostridiales bacterium]|nr:aminotransferase class I/II-fold pyridoxal phosphate-dependent enzyme [Clostridiales bacterium]
MLQTEHIELAAGSMDGIAKINKMFIDKGTVVLGYAPQFPDFKHDVESMGGIYEAVDMGGVAVKFDSERFKSEIKDRHAFCYIDNPNNPTGQIIPIETISEIVEKAANMDVCVLVDEAYGDFMEKENSAVMLLKKFDNLIVIKSFSKGFGMAGLRVGYIVGSKGLMDIYRKVSIPFSVNGIAADLTVEALKNEAFLDGSRKKIACAKKKVIDALRIFRSLETSLDVPIMTMFHPDERVDLYTELLKVGVLSIPGISFEGLGHNYVRLRIHLDVDALIERIDKLERIHMGGYNEL